QAAAMPLSRLYNVFFRRTSTFTLTIVLSALVFERVFDQAADAFYERLNQGVSRAGGVRPGAPCSGPWLGPS
uniref:Complex III subunit 9 n=1 Tax=Pelusios castaneus TaxID=367368 RepID=A0A8C8RW52_9SAUR